jgi:acyl-CoA reductase-like NAD-dependent aldehyde dehydrogenase
LLGYDRGITMAIAETELIVSYNPSTGKEIGRIPATRPETVAGIVAQARTGQLLWGATSWKRRRAVLYRFWRGLAAEADSLADLLVIEVGKPRGEAMVEVVATLDALRWTVKHGGRALAETRLGPSWQRWIMIPAARLRWAPIGVVGIIGTWNYPLFLNAPALAHALAAGNGAVWKASEFASLTGARLQRIVEQAGAPEGLIAGIQGGPDVGRALVDSEIDKGFFTGGTANGRRVLSTLASQGVPSVAELSGFDAAIVLPDAPREPTLRALTWAAFVGSGQTCVAVKRAYIVGDAAAWAGSLAERARLLRVGDPTGDVDIGPLISDSARDRFLGSIRAAVAAGARILAGGEPSPGPGWFVSPTVLFAQDGGPELELAGVFGPVLIVRSVPDVEAAVAAVNASPYGLSASVWSGDRRCAEVIARRLEVGMVAVNDAVAPSAHAAAPFGGMKASGFGRVRGAIGLREFARPQTIFNRSPGGFRPHLFPYSNLLGKLLALYRRLFHPSGGSGEMR